MCALCQTNYELDEFEKCPNCNSDKSKILSEIEPYYDPKLRRKARLIIIANAFGGLSLVLLLFKILLWN